MKAQRNEAKYVKANEV
jgi:adenylate kinase